MAVGELWDSRFAGTSTLPSSYLTQPQSGGHGGRPTITLFLWTRRFSTLATPACCKLKSGHKIASHKQQHVFFFCIRSMVHIFLCTLTGIYYRATSGPFPHRGLFVNVAGRGAVHQKHVRKSGCFQSKVGMTKKNARECAQ